MSTKWLGESSGNKVSDYRLLFRYVHSGNPYIVPISVDITTGIFTSRDPLPANPGQTINFITNYLNGYPPKLMSEWNGANTYILYVIDSTHFYFQTSGTNITSYASTIDLTNIVFEYNVASVTFDISKLKLGNHFKYRLVGASDRAGWRYVSLNYFDAITGTNKNHLLGVQDGRQFMEWYQETEYQFYAEKNLLLYNGGKVAYQQWNGGTSWSYANSIDPARSFMKIKPTFTSISLNFNVSNNTTFELYSD